MFGNFDLKNFIISVVVLVVSITLHEFGHAYSADRLGDDTPRRQGRITLWPDKHFDPIGFVMMLVTSATGYGIGWGKPVMVDFRNFRNIRRDDIIVTICGPLMNLLLAVVFGIIFRVAIATRNAALLGGIGGQFILSFVVINLSLMFFNLIPIYPLDGSHIMRRLLPPNMGEEYYRFIMQWGPLLLMVLVLSRSGILSMIIDPAVSKTMQIILGIYL